MKPLQILALLLTGLLSGMETVQTVDFWKEQEQSLCKIWTRKEFYGYFLFWTVFYLIIWIFAARNIYWIRLAEMISTYLLLAVIDIRRRIVPDSVLLCFFSGQLLWLAFILMPDEIFHIFVSGGIFCAVIMLFAWLSKGKMGMGDAELLGVTALVAGWAYAIQILVIALLLSFVFGIWLVLFRRISIRTEIPFVPFLAAAMLIHTIYIVL